MFAEHMLSEEMILNEASLGGSQTISGTLRNTDQSPEFWFCKFASFFVIFPIYAAFFPLITTGKDILLSLKKKVIEQNLLLIWS